MSLQDGMVAIYGPYVRDMLLSRYGIETTAEEGDAIVRSINWPRVADCKQFVALMEDEVGRAIERWRVARRVLTT